ncbi:MAG: hypothetical protein AAB489_01080 [Patescibacteria group bacterium]
MNAPREFVGCDELEQLQIALVGIDPEKADRILDHQNMVAASNRAVLEIVARELDEQPDQVSDFFHE